MIKRTLEENTLIEKAEMMEEVLAHVDAKAPAE
jgi:hypothetical protein